MKKALIMIMIALLMLSMAAIPAIGEEEIEYSPAGTPIKKSKPGGSGMNTTPPAGGVWIEMGVAGRPADGSIRVLIDGKFVTADVLPFIDSSDRTQAPFRAIGEALGCQVVWNDEDRKVTCTKEGSIVEMFIGNDTFWVNGKPQLMDTAPQIKDDRTFIPVRALGEALGCGVAWNDSALIVIITSNK